MSEEEEREAVLSAVCQWQAEELMEVIQDLNKCQDDSLENSVDATEVAVDLDSIEIENTFDIENEESAQEASLVMSDGSVLFCSLSFVKSSGYLLDMSKVSWIIMETSIYNLYCCRPLTACRAFPSPAW